MLFPTDTPEFNKEYERTIIALSKQTENHEFATKILKLTKQSDISPETIVSEINNYTLNCDPLSDIRWYSFVSMTCRLISNSSVKYKHSTENDLIEVVVE